MKTLSKSAQGLAPANIVKHDYIYQIYVSYIRAPTKDPRNKQRVLDQRTGRASSPYYVFIRVDKVPANVRPGEASSPQTGIYRYKLPANSGNEAQQLAKAKVQEIKRVLPQAQVGKPSQGTLPYPFGLMSTPELDAPDKPVAPAVAFTATSALSSIYDKARELEDIVANMQNTGKQLNKKLEAKIARASLALSSAIGDITKNSKEFAMVPNLIRTAQELEQLGDTQGAKELDKVVTEIIEGDREDIVPGGLSDDSDPEDFDPDQLAKGIKAELEHTTSPELALEIAMDHLMENDKYYDYLEKMENKMK